MTRRVSKRVAPGSLSLSLSQTIERLIYYALGLMNINRQWRARRFIRVPTCWNTVCLRNIALLDKTPLREPEIN